MAAYIVAFLGIFVFGSSRADGFWQTVGEEFKLDSPFYLWNRKQDVNQNNALNPHNLVATLPASTTLAEIRPNISTRFDDFLFDIKPRLQWQKSLYENVNVDDSSENDLYVNEAVIQYTLYDELFASYGREVILWGPSMFTSVSNPFFRNNGRADPFSEVQGRDFAKLVHVLNSSWSVTYMYNFDAGRDEISFKKFEPIVAAKIDYLGEAFYTSVVLSSERHGETRVGGYFGITANSAFLVYGEASLIRDSAALYPISNSVNTADPGFHQNPADDVDGIGLLGAGYTFLNGLTANFEFLYYSGGYDDHQADDYFTLADSSTQQLLNNESADLIPSLFNPGLQRFRKRYIFSQINYPDPDGNFDWSVRYTQNIDDQSKSISTTMTWHTTDNSNIFLLAVANRGDARTEFDSYIESLMQLGFTYYLF